MKFRAFFALPVLLAACTPAIEITQDPVPVGVFSNVEDGRISNRTDLTVRTYTAQGGERSEVAGMRCFARSEELSAEFASPAVLQVPRFVQSGRFDNRGRPSDLLLSCEGGDMKGATSITAVDKQVSTATNAGIAGAILTTVVTAAVASSTPWKFPNDAFVTVQ